MHLSNELIFIISVLLASRNFSSLSFLVSLSFLSALSISIFLLHSFLSFYSTEIVYRYFSSFFFLWPKKKELKRFILKNSQVKISFSSLTRGWLELSICSEHGKNSFFFWKSRCSLNFSPGWGIKIILRLALKIACWSELQLSAWADPQVESCNSDQYHIDSAEEFINKVENFVQTA